MQVPTAEICNAKWVRNSMRGYLEGLKDLNWIAGIIIDAGDVAGAKEVLPWPTELQ